MKDKKLPRLAQSGLSLLCILAVLAGILGTDNASAQDPDFDDDDFAEEVFEEEISDPLEPLNRGIFWFNDKADLYVLEPVAKGYDKVVPEEIQNGVSNFFRNIKYPIYLLSDLLQLEFRQAGIHTARFLINTTIGMAGLMDPATCMGFKHRTEDFGLTLAGYGIGPGPYLVLPFLGPSNFRDGFGLAVDSLVHPLSAVSYSSASDSTQFGVTYGSRALEFVDLRADMVGTIDAAKESAVDYYLFMQGAYYQYRNGLLKKGTPPEKSKDLFYSED